MKKIIRMTKPVFDNWQAPTMEEAFHETSRQLTNAFFGNGHPFREMMRKKVNDQDLAERRIKLFVEGMAKYTKHPKTGRRVVVFNVSSIMLEVGMADITLDNNITGTHQMQTTYIQGKLNEYMNEQGFNVPCKNPDEIERFLYFLSKDIPCIWDYFKVIEFSEAQEAED